MSLVTDVTKEMLVSLQVSCSIFSSRLEKQKHPVFNWLRRIMQRAWFKIYDVLYSVKKGLYIYVYTLGRVQRAACCRKWRHSEEENSSVDEWGFTAEGTGQSCTLHWFFTAAIPLVQKEIFDWWFYMTTIGQQYILKYWYYSKDDRYVSTCHQVCLCTLQSDKGPLVVLGGWCLCYGGVLSNGIHSEETWP